jgi:hypothetical protein
MSTSNPEVRSGWMFVGLPTRLFQNRDPPAKNSPNEARNASRNSKNVRPVRIYPSHHDVVKVLSQQVWKMTRPKPNYPSKREPFQWDEMLPDHVVTFRRRSCAKMLPWSTFPIINYSFQATCCLWRIRSCIWRMLLFTAGVYEENVDVKFVFAKSRVAPI